MADLTAKFQLIDEMSDKLSNIAESGRQTIEQWESAGEAVNTAFENIAGAVTTATSTVDGVATSIDSLQEVSDSAASSADTLIETMNEYNNAAEEAAAQTDYWTDAIGNYDKSTLEAVYTTEELVEMGLKSVDALAEQEAMFELCERSAESLNNAIEATAEIENELVKVQKEAVETLNELINAENISVETKKELSKAAETATAAMNELYQAEQEAAAAMEYYDSIITSGTTDLNEFEVAAERAGHSAEALAEANRKAGEAAKELTKATEKAAEEIEESGKKEVDVVEAISSALTAAGITSAIKEITETVYDLVTAFSEAESAIVKATGATGEALDGLINSMMNAYASSKSGSLDDIAGAIGEINTRMALTGAELTAVTGQFIDFADITGTNAVNSVQNVTKIMNKWGVEGENVESVLDKLAYAGQISGASVDTLSGNLITGAASFQEMGMSLDNAISLLSQLELYGMSGTTAITAIRTAVKNFSDDGLNAKTALQSVISEIANAADAAEATSIAIETFGSRAGVDMANAIRSGTVSIDSFISSLEEADGTLDKTAKTAQTLAQKWEQANKSISTAFIIALEPAISKISEGFADFMNDIGNFLNEHPKVTKAVTAIGVGIAVLVTGITSVTFATTVAKPAVISFGIALNEALGPIGWVTLGISALATAGAALIAMFSESSDVSDNMTMHTRKQYEELQLLNEEYEQTCEEFGKLSPQAGELALQISKLEDEYNNSAETIGEFTARLEEMGEAIENTHNTYEDAIKSSDDLYNGSVSLVSQLLVLSNQSDATGVTLDTMSGIVEKLNENYGDLGLTIDETTGKLNYSVSDLYDFVSQALNQQKQEAAMQGLINSLGQFKEVKEKYAEASRNLSDAWKDYDALQEEWRGEHPILKKIAVGAEMNWSSDLGNAFDKIMATGDIEIEAEENYTNLINDITEYCTQLGYTNEETKEFINQLESSVKAAEEFSAQMESIAEIEAEAVSTAYNSVAVQINNLCAAYDEAYEAAYESFQGQFGLFDEAKADMDSTVASAQAALDSQLQYWSSYLENIEVLKNVSAEDLGITQANYEALMSYVQSGSEEAAGLAASMVTNINNGNTEAITTLANTLAEVDAKQSEAAAVTANWITDFDNQMNEIEQRMQETVENMNLSSEAEASATATITSYANSIRAGKNGAIAAAKEVASAVSAALAGTSTTLNVNVNSNGTIEGHANGTTNAEDVFIAGEEGPELIVGKAGSTVFPTNETDKIINALSGYTEINNNYSNITTIDNNEHIGDYFKAFQNDITDRIAENYKQNPLFVVVPEEKESQTKTSETVKRILLEIAGSGTIEIGNSEKADKETILEILYENLKPVLMSIVQNEIFEEGELSYEY